MQKFNHKYTIVSNPCQVGEHFIKAYDAPSVTTRTEFVCEWEYRLGVDEYDDALNIQRIGLLSAKVQTEVSLLDKHIISLSDLRAVNVQELKEDRRLFFLLQEDAMEKIIAAENQNTNIFLITTVEAVEI